MSRKISKCPNCGSSKIAVYKTFDGTFASKIGKFHFECERCYWAGQTKIFRWRAKLAWNEAARKESRRKESRNG